MMEPFRLVIHAPDALVAFGGEGEDAGERTAAELRSDVASVRRALPAPEPGSELLVICQDRYRFVVGLLAAWQAGHSVALPPNGQPETIHALVRRPGVKLLLDDIDGGEGLDLRSLVGKGAASEPMAPIDPARRIATLYTSGSTGEHQPCPKLASQLLGEALSHVATFGLGPGPRVLATVPSHHIYGLLYAALAPLMGGGAFLRETPFHAETVAALLERHRVDVMVSVPAHLRGLEVLGRLPRLRRTFSSGAPLPASTAQMLRQRFGLAVTEVFGSSETGGIAWRDDPAASWKPFPGVVANAGEDGRLLLESPFVAPDVPRPHVCGDRVAPLPDGSFRLLGRVDGVIKVAGKRIALAEVEQRCLCLPGVRDAAATAVDVEGARGQEIWLVVATASWTPDGLRAQLLQWFDPVALPRRIKVVASLPREENGKITRRRLRALFEDPQRVRPFVKVLEATREERQREGGPDLALLEVPVREDLLFFRGHFDGMPILPGVVQLHGLVLRNVQRLWPDLTSLRKVKKLQFKRITQPRQVVTVRLTRLEGSRQVDFEIAREGQVCSCGILVFA
ncbi:MAG: acyl-CoA synthetase [Deltaproteobacteria bacterium]|nr:acyl-CoA synthetase [Deltaproteobacteria bacterium]